MGNVGQGGEHAQTYHIGIVRPGIDLFDKVSQDGLLLARLAVEVASAVLGNCGVVAHGSRIG